MTEAEKLRHQKRIERINTWWEKFNEKSRWKTAYHEAGHAVLAHRLGAKVVEVCIVEKGVSEAVWAYDPCRFEDHIIILMAGDIAGRRFFPKYTLDSIESDKQKIDMYLSKIRYGTRRANRLHFRNATKRMVNENWAAISRVATALMKHRKLTGDEVVAAIHSRARAPETRYPHVSVQLIERVE